MSHSDTAHDRRLWTASFISASFINFALILVFYLLLVVITDYAHKVLHASLSMGGLVMGVFIVGTLCGRLIIGNLMPRLGLKKTLLLGLTGFALSSVLYLYDGGIAYLLGVRFVHGFTLGIASTATGTFAAQVIPVSRKGEGISYFGMSSTLATAIGPLVGITLLQTSTFDVLFWVCVVVAMAILVLGVFTHIPPLLRKPVNTQEKENFFNKLIEPKALPIAMIVLLISLAYSSVLAFINAYATQQDLLSAAKWFFLVYAIVILISRPITGRLLDRKGSNAVIYPSFVLFVLGLLALSQAANTFLLLLSAALLGLGFGNIQSSTQAIAVRLAANHRIGIATTTFFIAMDAGFGFGPYVVGLILPHTGFSVLYAAMAGLMVVTMVLYGFLHGRHDKRLLPTR